MSYRDRLQRVFAHAEARGYAVPAFNYSDPWELKAIVRAAETERAPVLAAASASAVLLLGGSPQPIERLQSNRI